MEDQGDPRRCPFHGSMLSSPNGMHDAECPQCEAETDSQQEDNGGLPPGWENAPLSAQVAYLISDGDPDLFDEIKAHLKGE
jgi:hypothetical protein